MPRSRIPGSGAFVDRARRRGLGSCQTRGGWFATVCTHPTHVFQGGSCKGEEADGASIRGHLVSSQFPWEVKSRKRLSGGGSEIRTLRPRKRGTMLVETGTVRFQSVSALETRFRRVSQAFLLLYPHLFTPQDHG